MFASNASASVSALKLVPSVLLFAVSPLRLAFEDPVCASSTGDQSLHALPVLVPGTASMHARTRNWKSTPFSKMDG